MVEPKNFVQHALPATHPGEVLRDELVELGLTADQFAFALHMPVANITLLIAGKISVDLDVATRLGHFFGTTAEFLENLQAHHDGPRRLPA